MPRFTESYNFQYKICRHTWLQELQFWMVSYFRIIIIIIMNKNRVKIQFLMQVTPSHFVHYNCYVPILFSIITFPITALRNKCTHILLVKRTKTWITKMLIKSFKLKSSTSKNCSNFKLTDKKQTCKMWPLRRGHLLEYKWYDRFMLAPYTCSHILLLVLQQVGYIKDSTK